MHKLQQIIDLAREMAWQRTNSKFLALTWKERREILQDAIDFAEERERERTLERL